VPEVVEERRGEGFPGALGRDALPVGETFLNAAKTPEKSRHHESRADGVRKSRVIRAGIREGGESELADPPEALHLACLEEAKDNLLFGLLERHEAMNGVTKDHDCAGSVVLRRFETLHELV
jgi:hypothetical protein